MDSDDSSDDDDYQLVMSTLEATTAAIRNSDAALEDLIDSSDDDEAQPPLQWGGSRQGRSPNKKRDFDLAFNNIRGFYFNGLNSLYNEFDFERRFGCPRSVFNRIFDSINGHGVFVRKYNKLLGWGIHPLVRIVTCFRKLVYGDASDREDENLQISKSQIDHAFKDFCSQIVEKFGNDYLNRCPTNDEKQRCLSKMSCRGFPGCFASWDCKHVLWANCPTKLAGQHLGKSTVLSFV